MKKHWKVVVVLAAVVAIGLSVAAVAWGAAGVGNPSRDGAACARLTDNPEALAAMQELREEHRQEMRAWLEKYGGDSSSAAAKKALQALRSEHWTERKALFEKLGIDVPEGFGPGVGGGRGGMLRGGAPCVGGGGGAGAGLGMGYGFGHGGGMMGRD